MEGLGGFGAVGGSRPSEPVSAAAAPVVVASAAFSQRMGVACAEPEGAPAAWRCCRTQEPLNDAPCPPVASHGASIAMHMRCCYH
eukprot:COSAG01_NODE_1641_length_9647_cov_5.299539_14_plen_85_part_00